MIQIVTLLSDDSDNKEYKRNVLKNTYCAFKITPILDHDVVSMATTVIDQMKNEFMDETNAPRVIIGMAKEGFHVVDINMGCPAPNVVSNGKGCGLCDPSSRRCSRVDSCSESRGLIGTRS